MKFKLKDTKGLEWWRWLYLFAIWILVPGGTLILIAWLFVQEVRLDKELSEYYDDSFAEFMKRKRKQKEAGHDVHSVGN